MTRLRRSDCSGPGIARVRRGRGFSYRDHDGTRVADPAVVERIRSLAIPPAWREVWIAPDALGHIQATGIDAAGRKQYLYHPQWHMRRERAKFARMVRFGEAQPALRRRLAGDLSGSDPTRTRVIACAVRLLDLGLFRIGSEEYAEENGSFGLTTLTRDHVAIAGGELRFDYPAKSGVRRVHTVHEDRCAELVAMLKRRRGGGDELLAYRERRRWRRLGPEEINGYLKDALGDEYSAKDFRTWNATVIAATAVASATATAATGSRARERAIRDAVRIVADALGNTPAIARGSYIDPRVFDRYRAGRTIAADPGRLRLDDERDRRRIEAAVLDLLGGDHPAQRGRATAAPRGAAGS